MATAYTSFYDYVLPDVPGCPQALALRAIRDAVIEFCEKTGAWHIDHPAVNVQADTAAYPFAAGVANAVVHKILKAWHNSQEIYPATLVELESLYPGDWRTKTGTPQRFTQYNPRNVILVPKPNADLASGLTMIVSLKPSRTSTDTEDTLFEEYVDKIAAGVKAKLMMIPKKPYTDAEEAAIQAGIFDNAIRETADRVNRALTRAKRRVTSSFF